MNQNHFSMKHSFYLLICFSLFLASCSDTSSPGIPYKPVPKDTARLMILKYLTPGSNADTSFLEVPKVLSFDPKTLKTFTEKTKEGEVTEVRFILAAYLDSNRLVGLKNTSLLQIKRTDNKYYYYDLRIQWDPKKNVLVPDNVNPKDGVCPPPVDCIPPGVEESVSEKS